MNPRQLAGALLFALGGTAWAWPARPPLPALFPERALFDAALRTAARVKPVPQPLTAVVVPHHLLAADLIARGIALTAGQRPERIVLLGPDHFHFGRTHFSVNLRDFETCYGTAPADLPGAAALLADPRVRASNLFSHDHAFQAVVPFLARTFPGVPVLAVAIGARARETAWQGLAESLSRLAGPRTLVVQSTDFSHYLPSGQARACDQETLNVLATGDPAAVSTLSQPRHTDCRGALYVTLALCRRAQARPLVIENQNSARYAGRPVESSTSYMVILCARAPLDAPHEPRLVFAGDFFTGRHVAGKLGAVLARARAATGGAPAIVNFEGVLTDATPPPGVRPYLYMKAAPTIDALDALNVRAVSLANNHALDAGVAGRAATRAALEARGLPALLPGETRDVGLVHLSVLTDCDNSAPARRALLTTADLARLAPPPRTKPWVAFVHWGEEWTRTPSERELALTRHLAARGVDLIVGAHPHSAGGFTIDPGPTAYSLGNFVFDQTDPRADGALLELRFFPQGTWAPRLIPLGNLYRPR